MLMPKPKNYTCDNCGREQYTNDFCYGCKGTDFSPIKKEGTQTDNKYLSIPSDALENDKEKLSKIRWLLMTHFGDKNDLAKKIWEIIRS